MRLLPSKTSKNPYFKVKYDRIKKRRGHKRAIIAVARMILTCLYHMFLKKEAFQPSDIHYEELPKQLLQKRKEQYIQQAIKLLEKEGMTVTPPSVAWYPFLYKSFLFESGSFLVLILLCLNLHVKASHYYIVSVFDMSKTCSTRSSENTMPVSHAAKKRSPRISDDKRFFVLLQI